MVEELEDGEETGVEGVGVEGTQKAKQKMRLLPWRTVQKKQDKNL